MITFDSYKLDQVIDERIDQALNFGDVYGGDLFDDEGKVRTSEYIKIGFQPGHVIDILQQQQEQIRELSEYYQDTVVSQKKLFEKQIAKLWKEVEKL